MGYVHDTHMSQFIPPSEFQHSAGTWTISEASNLMKSARTAADAAFTTLIPIKVPSNSIAKKGAQLKSIDVWYAIGTAAADDFATVELEKVTLAAQMIQRSQVQQSQQSPSMLATTQQPNASRSIPIIA